MPNVSTELILPFNHTLSANYLTTPRASGNDHTWEICSDLEHPAGVSIESNLGLKVNTIQVIPVLFDAKSLPISITKTKVYPDSGFLRPGNRDIMAYPKY